jgi:hypothetical protein
LLILAFRFLPAKKNYPQQPAFDFASIAKAIAPLRPYYLLRGRNQTGVHGFAGGCYHSLLHSTAAKHLRPFVKPENRISRIRLVPDTAHHIARAAPDKLAMASRRLPRKVEGRQLHGLAPGAARPVSAESSAKNAISAEFG